MKEEENQSILFDQQVCDAFASAYETTDTTRGERERLFWEWLDFVYLDRHCHAMIRSISADDVKVGMVSDDTGEVVLPCLTIGIAQDSESRVRNVTAWRYHGIMRCGRGLYRTQGNTFIWNDGSEEYPWEILESSYGPMNDQGLLSILSDSDFPVVSVLPVDLTDEV